MKKVIYHNSTERTQSKEKTKIILELRDTYPKVEIRHWLEISAIPKSSYYEWKSKLRKVNEEEEYLKRQIRVIVNDSKGRYGYRRVTISLKNKGHVINHKRVSRLMKECNLIFTNFYRKSRNYSAYKGTIGKIAKNDLNRKFNISHPNEVWVTDVTEFRVGENKYYLSSILDLYNSEIISYSLSNNPTIKLTNDSLCQRLVNYKRTQSYDS